MKQLSKTCTSIFLTIVMLITLVPVSAFAANYSVNYWEHSEPTRTLSYTGGSQMNGDDVKWFQCAINNLVMNGDVNNSRLDTSKLNVDGYYGNASKTALKAFQRKYGLSEDGILGSGDRAKMKSVLRPAPYNPPEPTYEPVPRIIKDGVYYICNKLSKKYLSVSGGTSYNGAEIVQDSFRGGPDQQFRIKYVNGFYKIYPMDNESKCLDLRSPAEANSNGTTLMTYTGYDCEEQNFRFKVMNDLSVEIGSVNSYGNKVFEVTNSSKADGAIVQIWDRSDSRNNDDWYLEPVNDFTTDAPNQFNKPSSKFPLGSINYGGYRYKIVAWDDFDTNKYTKIKEIKETKWSFSIFQTFANLSIDGFSYNSTGVLGVSSIFAGVTAILDSIDKTDVTVTLYKSKSSNVRFATITAYDTVVQRQLNKDAGAIRTKKSEGRPVHSYLCKKQAVPHSQFDGYINEDGEFCIAFHTYSGDAADYDYVKVKNNNEWSNIIYKYGYDNAHMSIEVPKIAPDEYLNLFKKCIG